MSLSIYTYVDVIIATIPDSLVVPQEILVHHIVHSRIYFDCFRSFSFSPSKTFQIDAWLLSDQKSHQERSQDVKLSFAQIACFCASYICGLRSWIVLIVLLTNCEHKYITYIYIYNYLIVSNTVIILCENKSVIFINRVPRLYLEIEHIFYTSRSTSTPAHHHHSHISHCFTAKKSSVYIHLLQVKQPHKQSQLHGLAILETHN